MKKYMLVSLKILLPFVFFAQHEVQFTLKTAAFIKPYNQISFVNKSLPEYDVEKYGGSNFEVTGQVDYLINYKIKLGASFFYHKLNLNFESKEISPYDYTESFKDLLPIWSKEIERTLQLDLIGLGLSFSNQFNEKWLAELSLNFSYPFNKNIAVDNDIEIGRFNEREIRFPNEYGNVILGKAYHTEIENLKSLNLSINPTVSCRYFVTTNHFFELGFTFNFWSKAILYKRTVEADGLILPNLHSNEKMKVYDLTIRNRWFYPKLGFGFTL